MSASLSSRFSRRRSSTPAARDVLIVVRDGYHPETVTAPARVPVRLRFRRDEGGQCSDTVLIPQLGRYAELPERQTVTMDFGPLPPGDYEFSSPHGRIRGHLLVRSEP